MLGNKVFYFVLMNGGIYYIDDGCFVLGKFDEILWNLWEIVCMWYFNVLLGYDMLVDELENDLELVVYFFLKLGMLFYVGVGMV